MGYYPPKELSNRQVKFDCIVLPIAIIIFLIYIFVNEFLKSCAEDDEQQRVRIEEEVEKEMQYDFLDKYDKRLEDSENAEWRYKIKN